METKKIKIAKNIFSLFFLISLLFPATLQAQTDTELWTGGDFTYKINPRLSTQAEQVFKFNDTISHFKSAFTELSLKYKVLQLFSASILSVAGNYRFIENPPDKNAHRFSGDLIFNIRGKEFPLSFQSRHRFQHEVRIIDKRKEDYFRNKFTLEYNLGALVDPYISYELFFRFNGKNEFRIIRYVAGLDWKITPHWDVVIWYMYQKEINVKSPTNTNIIGLRLSYTLTRTITPVVR